MQPDRSEVSIVRVPSLIRLPTEIRVRIYDDVFEGAEIEFKGLCNNGGWCWADRKTISITQVCRVMRDEASPSFFHGVSIRVALASMRRFHPFTEMLDTRRFQKVIISTGYTEGLYHGQTYYNGSRELLKMMGGRFDDLKLLVIAETMKLEYRDLCLADGETIRTSAAARESAFGRLLDERIRGTWHPRQQLLRALYDDKDFRGRSIEMIIQMRVEWLQREKMVFVRLCCRAYLEQANMGSLFGYIPYGSVWRSKFMALGLTFRRLIGVRNLLKLLTIVKMRSKKCPSARRAQPLRSTAGRAAIAMDTEDESALCRTELRRAEIPAVITLG